MSRNRSLFKFSWIGIAAFFIVLLCMPLGHAAMILMEHFDYAKFACDLFMGDYWFEDGYVFRCS